MGMCVWRAPAMTLHFLFLQYGLIGNGLPISPLKPLHLLYARESAGIPVCAGSVYSATSSTPACRERRGSRPP